MADGIPKSAEDQYLERLKASRTRDSVLKTQIALLRSRSPDVAILVFEGDDDKIVYFQWLNRVRPNLAFEVFVSKGKGGVRQLKSVLSRDVNGLRGGMFFFVDRDFDDLRGFVDSDNLFVTDMYSIENYLVSTQVLDGVLKSEFPCHGRPDVRASIINVFEEQYDRFLRVTFEINRRMYIARTLNYQIRGDRYEQLNNLANISLLNVEASNVAPESLIDHEEQVSISDNNLLTEEFSVLEPRSRYRGKFALKFFRAWLECLANECQKPVTDLFQDTSAGAKPRRNELTLSKFASCSPLPAGFQDFVQSIT